MPGQSAVLGAGSERILTIVWLCGLGRGGRLSVVNGRGLLLVCGLRNRRLR